MKRWSILFILSIAGTGCGEDGAASAGGITSGGGTDGFDADSGSASGASGTSGTSGFGTDGDGMFVDKPDVGPPPPPEEEDEADFRVPRASGRFVYSASETTHRVAVIDSSSLAIDVVTVGNGPTVVMPIPDAGDGGAVAVLNQASDEVSFVRTDAKGNNTVELRPGSEGANNLAISPDGSHLFVYHDVDGPAAPQAGSTQELAILSTAPKGPSWQMAVGANPRDIAFTPDGKIAYVVTDDGVNVIELALLESVGKPDVVPVAPDTAIDPALLEVQISPSTGHALARVDGEAWVAVTDLTFGTQTIVTLPGYITDLDVAADGSFALATLPASGGSTLVEIALPIAMPAGVAYEVPGEYVGVAALAPDGATAILYTTVAPTGVDGPDPRQRITIARRVAGAWTGWTTLFVEVPVKAVGLAPDSKNAILLHAKAPEINSHAPWPYTLLDLTTQFPIKKLQTAEAEPGPILFTPDGMRAAVLLRDDAGAVRRVDRVNLANFIVDGLQLGSPPEGAGYVGVTQKIFVSQEHPSGRITFLGKDGSIQTVTGYELNDAVKD